MRSDGTEDVAITPIGNPFYTKWSWGGDKVAYGFSNSASRESQTQHYIYDIESARSIPVSSPYKRGAVSSTDGPCWSADDKYVSYKLMTGPSRSREIWVAETRSGKNWRIVADRGGGKSQRWSPFTPSRLGLLVESSGNALDVATVDPDGRNLVVLTDVAGQSIRMDRPRWSPTGDWIAYKNDADLTQSERDRFLEDCWISRPDGSEARNLTNASSPSTEEQLDLRELYWSWDGRWILSTGHRLDKIGSFIPTLYMIDPIEGGYKAILTSEPHKTGMISYYHSVKWSYDSSRIFILCRRFVVKNWGPEPQHEEPKSELIVYDMASGEVEEILTFDNQQDRKRMFGGNYRQSIADMTLSPDSRSILITVAKIISAGDGLREPDVYRLDLPERFVGRYSSRYDGPAMGREPGSFRPSTQPEVVSNTSKQGTDNSATTPINGPGHVTEVVRPRNITAEEAISSLSATYEQYLTVNASRNLLLFKGPQSILRQLRSDLRLIDSSARHILVDFLAVELTDEANRNLGLDLAVAKDHFGFFQPVGNAIGKFPHVGTSEDMQAGFPSGALDSLNAAAGQGQSFYQGVGTLPSEFYVRLNTLVRDGEATILANPRTVAMSGKEALVNIRKTLNYFFNEGFDVSGRPIVKKSDISADTEGRIVPRLLANGSINLQIDVKVGTFTFTKDAGLPELTTRQSTTEVTVQAGQTLLIGGLRQHEITRVSTKVPVLGDLPIVGILFRQQENDVRQSVLTILITPRVLNDDSPTPEWPTIDIDNKGLFPIDRSHRKQSLSEALSELIDAIE
jgi:Tol biopolymer transport system component